MYTSLLSWFTAGTAERRRSRRVGASLTFSPTFCAKRVPLPVAAGSKLTHALVCGCCITLLCM